MSSPPESIPWGFTWSPVPCLGLGADRTNRGYSLLDWLVARPGWEPELGLTNMYQHVKPTNKPVMMVAMQGILWNILIVHIKLHIFINSVYIYTYMGWKKKYVGTGLAFWASWWCQFAEVFDLHFQLQGPVLKGWRPWPKKYGGLSEHGDGVEVCWSGLGSQRLVVIMDWLWKKPMVSVGYPDCTSMCTISWSILLMNLCRTMSMILHSYIYIYISAFSSLSCFLFGMVKFENRLMDQHLLSTSAYFLQGLLNVPFWVYWVYWTSPYSSHLVDHIPNGI